MRALMRTLRPTSFEDVSALLRAVPAGPDGGQHAQRLRRPQERAQADRVPPPRPRGGARRHLRADGVPGVDDAGGPAGRRLLARRRRPAAPGMRQEDPRADRQGAGQVRRRRRAHGLRRALGTRLFDIIEPFADYAFNKSHAYGYGLVAYQTAYLKAHYPVEYLACLLTSVKSSLEKAAVYIAECRAHGHPGAHARRQPVGDQLRRAVAGRGAGRRHAARRLARRDHVRAVGGAQRRRGARRAAARRARGQRPVRRASTSSPTGCPSRCSTSGRSSR